ncbi:hypothetical protein C8R46DRAFT_1117248 [Mycena filopes]|nr:hypothetical protein C8R46DRAFT_1117248 [Mycena filopes]
MENGPPNTMQPMPVSPEAILAEWIAIENDRQRMALIESESGRFRVERPPSGWMVTHGAQNASHALSVRGMEQKLLAQEKELVALKRENLELWQEIRRLKGPRFPFEIFSAIIMSSGDKKALKMFSLVSRGWMSVARKVLFQRICYVDLQLAPRAVRRPGYFDLQPAPRMPQIVHSLPHVKAAHSLPNLLKDHNCTLAPHVQRLELGAIAHAHKPLPRNGMVLNREWMNEFLPLIPRFVALRSLDLYHLIPRDLRSLLGVMRRHRMQDNITELAITSSYAYSLPQLATDLSGFTRLKTLSYTNQGAWSGDFTEDIVRPSRSITTLVLRSLSSSDVSSLSSLSILRWFVSRHSGIISTLHVADVAFEYPVEFGHFLTRFGPTLLDLRFDIGAGPEIAEYFIRSDWCAALQHLKSFRVYFRNSAIAYSPVDKAFLAETGKLLPHILGLVPPTIQHITLVMRLVSGPSAASDLDSTTDWVTLDHSLAGARYPALRVLKIRMTGAGPPSWPDLTKEMAEMWCSLLPNCSRKGILEVDASDVWEQDE